MIWSRTYFLSLKLFEYHPLFFLNSGAFLYQLYFHVFLFWEESRVITVNTEKNIFSF